MKLGALALAAVDFMGHAFEVAARRLHASEATGIRIALSSQTRARIFELTAVFDRADPISVTSVFRHAITSFPRATASRNEGMA